MVARIVTVIVIISIMLIYVLYNTEPVTVRFLFWEIDVSKALITLGSLLAGIILGLVMAKIDQVNKERKKRSLYKQLGKERR